MAELFRSLLDDARERNLLCDAFYYLSDPVLARFKMLQGFDPFTEFPGCRLEQATLIWQQSPFPVRNAVLAANGFDTSYQPLLPELAIRFDE